jgi:hypothetical protein
VKFKVCEKKVGTELVNSIDCDSENLTIRSGRSGRVRAYTMTDNPTIEDLKIYAKLMIGGWNQYAELKNLPLRELVDVVIISDDEVNLDPIP